MFRTPRAFGWDNEEIFFNILLTVHLNIFVYEYQPSCCTKFYNKYISSLYMFRAHVLIVRRAKLYYTVSGIITPIGVMIPETV